MFVRLGRPIVRVVLLHALELEETVLNNLVHNDGDVQLPADSDLCVYETSDCAMMLSSDWSQPQPAAAPGI